MTTKTAPSSEVIQKAMRYLLNGKVSIDYADKAGRIFSALVTGSADLPYTVTHLPGQGWRCTCPANRFQGQCCTHLIACQAVWQPVGG